MRVGLKEYLKEIMAPNVPNLAKETNLQIEEIVNPIQTQIHTTMHHNRTLEKSKGVR